MSLENFAKDILQKFGNPKGQALKTTCLWLAWPAPASNILYKFNGNIFVKCLAKINSIYLLY